MLFCARERFQKVLMVINYSRKTCGRKRIMKHKEEMLHDEYQPPTLLLSKSRGKQGRFMNGKKGQDFLSCQAEKQ